MLNLYHTYQYKYTEIQALDKKKQKNSTDNNSLLLLYLGCFKVSIYPSNQNIAAVKKPLRWLIDPSNSMSPKHSGGGQRWSSRTGPRVVNISHWSSSFSFRHSLQGLATANHLLPSNLVLCIFSSHTKKLHVVFHDWKHSFFFNIQGCLVSGVGHDLADLRPLPAKCQIISEVCLILSHYSPLAVLKASLIFQLF